MHELFIRNIEDSQYFQAHNKGIEIDIISAALSYKGHTLKPLYSPLGRVPIAFKSKLVDAAIYSNVFLRSSVRIFP